jgi:hypothetical protein
MGKTALPSRRPKTPAYTLRLVAKPGTDADAADRALKSLLKHALRTLSLKRTAIAKDPTAEIDGEAEIMTQRRD